MGFLDSLSKLASKGSGLLSRITNLTKGKGVIANLTKGQGTVANIIRRGNSIFKKGKGLYDKGKTIVDAAPVVKTIFTNA